MPETVKTVDNSLKIYKDRDLGSQIITELEEGVEVKLGACTIHECREWLEATVGDAVGYVLAPSARGHTTLSPPNPSPKGVSVHCSTVCRTVRAIRTTRYAKCSWKRAVCYRLVPAYGIWRVHYVLLGGSFIGGDD